MARELGDKLKRARLANGLTLTQLAHQTGLSEAFLSRLERAQAAASVANLIEITDALGVGMHDLFTAETRVQKTAVAVHRAKDKGPAIEAQGYRWQRLGGGAPRDQLGAFLLLFAKGGKMPVMVSHAGQEYCRVLAGEIDFHVGDEIHRLRAGDSIFISSDLPHRVANVGQGEARLLMTAAHEPHGMARSPPNGGSPVSPDIDPRKRRRTLNDPDDEQAPGLARRPPAL
jgi:transcriptional regulator with XRE-family HTH domain